MSDIDIIKLMALDEVAFIKELQSLLQKGAGEGDVIPLMIQYNVPLFVLHNVWPEKEAELRAHNTRLAFAVAEDGWQGKVYNIKSNLQAAGEKDHFQLQFQKSYVIDCDAMLVLARYANDFAICYVPREASTQDWQSRGEADVLLPTRSGTSVDHYRVQADLSLREVEFQPISQKAYARLGMQIPLREASSLCLLSLALLRKTGIPCDTLKDHETALLAARARGRLKRADMQAAREILNVFYEKIEAAQLEVHPFWLRAKGLLKVIPA